jgi:T5orf172 domain
MVVFSKLDYRHIYILGNTRYIFRYKIGIAHNIESRKRSISNSVRGDIYEIYSVKVFFAHKIEKMLHGFYSPLNASMKGSGKTEWFWMILPVSPTILLMFIWVLQWLIIPSLLVSMAYIWQHQEQVMAMIAP